VQVQTAGSNVDGCVTSEGYVWCAILQRCVKPWESTLPGGKDKFDALCAVRPTGGGGGGGGTNPDNYGTVTTDEDDEGWSTWEIAFGLFVFAILVVGCGAVAYKVSSMRSKGSSPPSPSRKASSKGGHTQFANDEEDLVPAAPLTEVTVPNPSYEDDSAGDKRASVAMGI